MMVLLLILYFKVFVKINFIIVLIVYRSLFRRLSTPPEDMTYLWCFAITLFKYFGIYLPSYMVQIPNPLSHHNNFTVNRRLTRGQSYVWNGFKDLFSLSLSSVLFSLLSLSSLSLFLSLSLSLSLARAHAHVHIEMFTQL